MLIANGNAIKRGGLRIRFHAGGRIQSCLGIMLPKAPAPCPAFGRSHGMVLDFDCGPRGFVCSHAGSTRYAKAATNRIGRVVRMG